ncbi:MAG: hypothetical protein RL398_3260, partial [Planctomycetota bacterium]
DDPSRLRAEFRKAFHVSPFQPMEQRYEWLFSEPGETLAVHMENTRGSELAVGAPREKVFDATLAVHRRPWDGRTLAATALRHPWPSAKVLLLIYWHALRLWLKKAPFFDHP